MRKTLLTTIVAIAAVALFAGCRGGKKQDEAESQEKVLVKTEIADYTDVHTNVEFTSNILPYKENNIAPSLPVRIDDIRVDVGDAVVKGQLLVRMDPTQFNQANVQLSNLKSDFERVKRVYEAGGVSKQELDQLETQLSVQQDQVDDLRRNIELRSPIAGVVTKRSYDPGDMFGMEPVLQVMQINTLKVSVAVSEKYFPLVSLGMGTKITVDMYKDRFFEGKVSRISPAIDPATRTFDVEVTIPNSKLELRPGMFSRTLFYFGSHRGIAVEDMAIQTQVGSNDKFLFVVKDGKAVRRNVTVALQVGSKIEIISGVEVGDEVVITGVSRLESGYAVESEPYSQSRLKIESSAADENDRGKKEI